MDASQLAKLIQLAEIKNSDVVLVIGTGTGYGAAIVGQLAKSVIAIEEDAGLAAEAGRTLAAVGARNVEVMTGELIGGAKSKAPFDVIIIEGAVDTVPESLAAQLAEGGRLVAVEGVNLTGVARVHVKSGNSVSARRGFNLAIKPLAAFRAVPAFSL